MLIILDMHDKLNTPEEYDTIVRAEIPHIENEPELYNVVVHHMIHGQCAQINPRTPCMKHGSCKKSYLKNFAESMLQSDDSYPIYRRRNNG